MAPLLPPNHLRRSLPSAPGDNPAPEIDRSGRPSLDASLWQPLVFAQPCHEQKQTGFFRLPWELKRPIYEEVILGPDWESPVYDPHIKGHRAPCTFNLALLRTCQRTYHDSKFLPFARARHVFLQDDNIAQPSRFWFPAEMEMRLGALVARHGHTIELDHVYVDMVGCARPPYWLQRLVQMRHFKPKCITFSLYPGPSPRWDGPEVFALQPSYLAFNKAFPASLREVRVEIEALKHNKDSLRLLAKTIGQDWVVTRTDGVQLVPLPDPIDLPDYTGISYIDANVESTRRYCRVKLIFKPSKTPTKAPVSAKTSPEQRKETISWHIEDSDGSTHTSSARITVPLELQQSGTYLPPRWWMKTPETIRMETVAALRSQGEDGWYQPGYNFRRF